jgi:SAM-dependent methyltransferase
MAWAIPDEIRASAPSFPYEMDPALFRPHPEPASDSLATQRALEGLEPDDGRPGGAAIDVGCGGGAASMALAHRLASVTGVDQSADMLAVFAEEAAARGVGCRTIEGTWPDRAIDAGKADLVLCHHVAYNVADLAPFVRALDAAGNRRVVMELTLTHPQTANAPLWRQFWDLERPSGPTADDALSVIREAGIDASIEIGDAGSLRTQAPLSVRAVTAARMLCLGPERLAEVERAVSQLPPRSPDRAVIWWDVSPGR